MREVKILISYIRGTLEYINENFIIVENNDIGYNIQISQMTLSNLPQKGDIVKIYTYMNVKEDAISFYGFLKMEELDVFNMLITVSGVGPKGALSMLSSMSPGQILLAIVTEDIVALSRGQGIGKKTAQRITLELRDKVKSNVIIEDSNNFDSLNKNNNSNKSEKQDAIEALLGLGFSRSEAVKAVMDTSNDEMNSQQIIKNALKKLSK